jgi:hypothetical protein
MAPQSLIQTQRATHVALPGTWKLAARHAITLRPREAGTLRVAHGRMWATYDGPHRGPLNDPGDHVIGVGEQLRLAAGQRLVIEAWDAAEPAYFSWNPLPVRAGVAVPRSARMAQPLADLRQALVLGAGAAGRLALALAGLAWEVLARRGRRTLADCAFPAEAKTCGAHGAMS